MPTSEGEGPAAPAPAPDPAPSPTAIATATSATATDPIPRAPEASESVLDRVAEVMRSIASSSSSSGSLTQIGNYRLHEIIGEGGMGVVFRAEQLAPIRRTVALKLIRPGMVGREVLARFQGERQALALMSHPNVARVLDAGTSEQGRPYFVMEHVPGEPITAFCDAQRLSLRQRLELFAQACAAVQHAHQKAIIHRDLKPSNILVMRQDDYERPCVKVIDFGVAKALLGESLAERTLHTESGQMIGTPEYMSPEQARGDGSRDVDTRSDIYSLGVVLYELLTGVLPFDPRALRSSGIAGIERTLREVDPPRPSRRLSSLSATEAAAIADRRQTRIGELTRQLNDELEWIPLKAMRKEPGERYASAPDLAQDIENFLQHRPLMAGPESRAYRLRKFLKRNRLPVAAVAGVLIVLLGSLIGVSLALAEARAAKREADRRAAELEQVAEFQASQLSGIDVELMGVRLRNRVIEQRRSALQRSGLDEERLAAGQHELEASLAGINFTSVALDTLDDNIFDRARKAIDEQFAAQPLVKARLMETLALTMNELGLLDGALTLLQEGLALRRAMQGDDHLETILTIHAVSDVLREQGKYAEAEPYIREALERSRRVLGNDHPDTITIIDAMGQFLGDRGDLVEAEPYVREAMERSRRALGEEHSHTLGSINSMSSLLKHLGRFSEAETYAREVLEKSRRVLGNDDPKTLIALNNLGYLLDELGRFPEAEICLREAVASNRRILGDAHPDTVRTINNLASNLQAQAKLDDAEARYREALQTGLRTVGEDHPNTLISLANLGGLLMNRREFPEAESCLRRALEGLRRTYGNAHGETLGALSNYASLLTVQGKLGEAEPYAREALITARQILGNEHAKTLTILNNFGTLQMRQNKLDEAEACYREALETSRRVLGNEHPRTLHSVYSMGDVLQAKGKFFEAEPFFREAQTTRLRVLGADHLETLRSTSKLGGLLVAMKRFGEATEVLEPALAAARQSFTAGNAHLLGTYLQTLGRARAGMNEFAAAEAALVEAHQIIAQTRGNSGDQLRASANRLVDFYESWHAAKPGQGYDAKAEHWRAEAARLRAVMQATSQPATQPTTQPATQPTTQPTTHPTSAG